MGKTRHSVEKEKSQLLEHSQGLIISQKLSCSINIINLDIAVSGQGLWKCQKKFRNLSSSIKISVFEQQATFVN